MTPLIITLILMISFSLALWLAMFGDFTIGEFSGVNVLAIFLVLAFFVSFGFIAWTTLTWVLGK